jgi:putative membrane protein
LIHIFIGLAHSIGENGVETSLAHTPYCGMPPSPAELFSRWNLDPVLIACLVGAAVLYTLGARRQRAVSRYQCLLFYAGWFVTSAALVSPLCPLSVSLFAARVAQHAILILVAAPLVMAGRPFLSLGALWPKFARIAAPLGFLRVMATPIPAAGLFAVLLWFWHMPAPYAATFDSDLVYWVMHLTLFGSALLLWSALSLKDDSKLPQVVAAGILTSIQMTFLGALITLTPHALYAPHRFTTAAWDLSPLQDQEIGGLIMWVPGCAVFLAVAIMGLVLAMRRADRVYA